MIDEIGIYEYLYEDLKRIFSERNVEFNHLPHVNQSKHKKVEDYFNNKFFKSIINLKVRQDLDFYNKILKQRVNK